jgi:hypothetical protein
MRFNRNKHKINGFMTDELSLARNRTIELHKILLKNKTLEDTQNYIAQRKNKAKQTKILCGKSKLEYK